MGNKRLIGVTLLTAYLMIINIIALFMLLFPARFNTSTFPPPTLFHLFINPIFGLLGEKGAWIGALIFIAIGYYVFKLKEFARKSLIIIQSISIPFGFLEVFSAMWSVYAKPIHYIGIILVNIIVPVIFIVFFTRPKVKLQFIL